MNQTTNIQNNTGPVTPVNFTDKIISLLSKLDTLWGKFLIIIVIASAGYKLGEKREELIKIAEINRIETNYRNEVLDLKEKYINEIIALKQQNTKLENKNEALLEKVMTTNNYDK